MTGKQTRRYQQSDRWYGDPQHETGEYTEPIRYGEPQYGDEEWDPEEVHRLGYEDDHWIETSASERDREVPAESGQLERWRRLA